ncbi:MAG: MotA/TolQ/ExbB proton channel family protein [Bacteroidia bacterium]
MNFLLQLPDTAAPAALQNDNFFSYLAQGGWPMIPLGILLVAAIYLFVERYLTIRKANTDSEDFMKQLRVFVLKGKLDDAKRLCESRNDPFSRMIYKGVSRLGSASLKDIEGSIENVGKLEVIRLERRLPLLATIAGAAPMIGFMGTALGMIEIFAQLTQASGTADPKDLAGGMSVALITTVAGLVVGILAYLGYNILIALVNKVVFKLELTATDFLDLLQEPA